MSVTVSHFWMWTFWESRYPHCEEFCSSCYRGYSLSYSFSFQVPEAYDLVSQSQKSHLKFINWLSPFEADWSSLGSFCSVPESAIESLTERSHGLKLWRSPQQISCLQLTSLTSPYEYRSYALGKRTLCPTGEKQKIGYLALSATPLCPLYFPLLSFDFFIVRLDYF